MTEVPQHQEAIAPQPAAPPGPLQRGHSGEGSHTALELMRRRRELQALGAQPPEAPVPPPDGEG